MLDGSDSLLGLLRDAVPLDVYIASRGDERPARSSSTSSSNSAAGHTTLPANVADGVAVVNFLLEKGVLDLSGYPAWNALGIAFKNTYGEDGFPPWLVFSEAADGFDSEEACRKAWDLIKLRPEGERLTIATYIAKATELGWRPTKSASKGVGKSASDPDGGDGGPGKGEDHAAYTVRLVESAGDELWLDQEGKPHVTYEASGPDGATVKRHLPVLSGGYRDVLKDRFFDAAGGKKTLKKEQADDAAAILAARAKRSGAQNDARLRVGELNGCIYADLGGPDGKAVEVSATGWKVIDEPPVRFVRGTRGTLPEPQPGGTLADFKAHFNVSTEDLWRLVGFMIGVFNVTGSYAILMTDGEQGSGKSSLNDKVLGLTDPPWQVKNGRMSFNNKEEDLHIGALGAHVLYFDNVSSFNADAADMLCRIATGGASGKRELYTNDQFAQFTIIRPVVLTCIGVPSSRADLLDRSITITAEPFAVRRTERAVQAAFNADRPKLFGFLLTCVAAALKNRDSVEAAVEAGELELPRMADFAAFVEGAAEPLGLARGEFSSLLRDGQNAMQIESVTGHPVGEALIRHFSRPNAGQLNGSASDLLKRLKDVHRGEQRWPASNVFGKALQRLSVGLRRLGIEWASTAAQGHDNVAKYVIRATDRFQPQSLEPRFDERDPGDDGGGHF